MAKETVIAECIASFRRCLLWAMPGVDYPRLHHEVVVLLASLQMTPRHVRKLYRIFQRLRSHDSILMSTSVEECSVNSVIKLVKYRTKWVAKILSALIELGGFKEIVSWNGFVYILLKFCTLSRLEIAQVMFYIITRDVKSWTVHFVTTSQLEEFYYDYEDCDIMSYNTSRIGFSSLPMAKYNMVDFIELTYRFSQLINPCIHLQRSLQQSLPSLRFWTDFDRVKLVNRLITLDFFRPQKVTSLFEMITGVKASMEDRYTMQAQLKAQKALMDAEANENKPRDPKSEVKRFPPVAADMPMPYVGPNQPGYVSPRALRPPLPPPIPAWIQETISTNKDPVTGIALGTAAIQPSPPAWSAPLDSSATVEEAKSIIKGTHRVYRESLIAHDDGAIPSVITKGSSMDIKRTQELDFICKARGHVDKRDNFLKCIERTTQCEVVTRKPL
eukprot:TRINITY_DN10754_c0_g3_i1.p1 TRINITY_DN10754_c0_g3~~TRINITY_DN10754_c0_g3_i1.p1  ORF type:complete len:444 (-),score=68.13 TRINITY_DN10754_c0_g3_i1:52-1383(-)